MTDSSSAKMSTARSGDAQVKAIVVMGVSGCGKSTVGQALARRLGWRFADGDDFHPPANVEKMRAGIPLDDDDRAPWLARLNETMREAVARDEPLVLACSALRQRYRERLAEGLPQMRIVHLAGSIELIGERLAARNHSYMPPSLLTSQFATLEPPADALTLDVGQSVDDLVDDIVASLRPAAGPTPLQSKE